MVLSFLILLSFSPLAIAQEANLTVLPSAKGEYGNEKGTGVDSSRVCAIPPPSPFLFQFGHFRLN